MQTTIQTGTEVLARQGKPKGFTPTPGGLAVAGGGLTGGTSPRGGTSPLRQSQPAQPGSLAVFQADGYLTDGGISGRAAPMNVSNAAPITIPPQDQVILVNNTTGAPITVAIPNGQSVGQFLWVKDMAGNSTTYPITVTSLALIDGMLSRQLGSNYASMQLVWSGSTWGRL